MVKCISWQIRSISSIFLIKYLIFILWCFLPLPKWGASCTGRKNPEHCGWRSEPSCGAVFSFLHEVATWIGLLSFNINWWVKSIQNFKFSITVVVGDQAPINGYTTGKAGASWKWKTSLSKLKKASWRYPFLVIMVKTDFVNIFSHHWPVMVSGLPASGLTPSSWQVPGEDWRGDETILTSKSWEIVVCKVSFRGFGKLCSYRVLSLLILSGSSRSSRDATYNEVGAGLSEINRKFFFFLFYYFISSIDIDLYTEC